MKKHLVPVLVILAAVLMGPPEASGQTVGFSARPSLTLEKRIVKNLSLELAPEVRFGSSFIPESYLLQAGLDYKLTKWLSVGGVYRFKADASKPEGSETAKTLETTSRFALDATGNVKFSRFTPQLRVRYCNYTDFDNTTDDKTDFLRYRLKVAYNIRGLKLTPYIACELFQKLSSGLFSQNRYTLGAGYDFGRSTLFAAWSLEDAYSKDKLTNIVELGFKFKF